MTLPFRDETHPPEKTTPAKPIFQVPYARNGAFTGRETLLDEIHEDLRSDELPKHVQAFYGLGGVGKTQVAVEFAYRFAEDFPIVYWIRAQDRSSILLDFAGLARAIGLTLPPDATFENVRQAVRKHLEHRGDYLLIFDNAVGAEELRDFIPDPCRGAVMITSRNANWGAIARSAAVHGWTRDDSVQFLRRRSGRMDSDTSARKLAQALGDLPLALEQAAAMIALVRISFADYLHMFETLWAELLTKRRPTGEYPDSVAMTWELSLRQAEAENPSALRLLNLLAFLGPDGVSRPMLVNNFEHLPEDLSLTVVNHFAMQQAVTCLQELSLITLLTDPDATLPDRTVISLHRMVAALARDRLSDDDQRHWATTAARLVAGVFVFDSTDPFTWSAAAQALPHALAAANHAQATGVPVEITCLLLDQAGRYLNRFAQYPQARELFDRALSLSRRAYGDESPRVSAIANNLGRVLARLGQRDLARQHFEWALAIDRNTYGDDPHAATVMNNYAMVLHATGQLDAAREHFESALAIFENQYGSEHPKVATLLNNLGYIHQSAGDHQSAHDLFQRALIIAEQTLGGAHPTLASILHNLGRSLFALGRPLTARDQFERALAIDQQAYGDAHPDVLRDCISLAALARKLNDTAAVARYDERVQEIHRSMNARATQAPAASQPTA